MFIGRDDDQGKCCWKDGKNEDLIMITAATILSETIVETIFAEHHL